MKAVAASAATKRRWSESSAAPTKKALKKAGVKAVADTVSGAATDKVAATANVASMTAAGMSMTTPTANAVA